MAKLRGSKSGDTAAIIETLRLALLLDDKDLRSYIQHVVDKRTFLGQPLPHPPAGDKKE